MEVPRLGAELELQLPTCTTAAVMWDPSRICNLHCSLQERCILDPLSEASDQTHILMDTSQVLNPLSHNGNSSYFTFKPLIHFKLIFGYGVSYGSNVILFIL